MTNFTVDLNVINAAIHLTAKKDVRYYLQGACFEMVNGTLRIISTDGNIMSVIEPQTKYSGLPDFQVIIPLSTIPKDVLKHKVKTTPCNIYLDHDQFTISQNGLSFTGKLIDGRFPDWCRVAPGYRPHPDNESVTFNPELITRAGKMYATLYNTKMQPVRILPALKNSATTVTPSVSAEQWSKVKSLVVFAPIRENENLTDPNTLANWIK